MPNRIAMNLLPAPRSLKLSRGTFTLPKQKPLAAIKVVRTHSAPNHPEGYALVISNNGIEISFREPGGLRAASATLRQLLRQYGRRLPCLRIRDWPDFARRGVMLDISRGRVPKLETLLDLAEKLADFKINELQLYTEHTFAYRKYKSVWQSWGALTGERNQKRSMRAAVNSALTLCRTRILSAICASSLRILNSKSSPKFPNLTKTPAADLSAAQPLWRQIIPAPCPFCAVFMTNCFRISQAGSSTSAATRPGIWAVAKAKSFASDTAKVASIWIS